MSFPTVGKPHIAYVNIRVVAQKLLEIVSSNFASADFRKIKTYNFQKS